MLSMMHVTRQDAILNTCLPPGVPPGPDAFVTAVVTTRIRNVQTL